MDPDFWHARWRDNDIGFHQARTHDQLAKFWVNVAEGPNPRVFVPLCGKSLDMVWLAAHGCHVVGVELSTIAIQDFFATLNLAPEVTTVGPFARYVAGPYELFAGDVFAFTAEYSGPLDAAYDRAALIALKPEQRRDYAAHLARLMPAASTMLVIAIDYPKGEIEGPPFAVPADEITTLFTDAFTIERLECRDGLAASANLKARGVSRLEESAYKLVRRS